MTEGPFFTYRPRYYLLHPWKIVIEVWSHLFAFWQRGRRGWADRDTWSMDCYVAEVIGPMLRHLADTSHVVPCDFGIDMHAIDARQEGPELAAWKSYLRDLASSFDAYLAAREGDGQYLLATYDPVLEKMRRLFDRYPSLWS